MHKMTPDTNRHNILLGCLSALGAQILYGMSFIFTRQAVAISSPLALLGWRFLTAFLAMSLLAVSGLFPVHLKEKSLKPLLALALFCPVIYFSCETLGIQRTTASESGVVIACIPVAALIASAVFLRKKPSLLQAAGILLTLSGVLVTVFSVGVSSSFSIPGYLFLLTAVTSYALYSVSVEKASGYSSAEITSGMLLEGAVVFAALAAFEAFARGNIKELLFLPFTSRDFLIAVLYGGLACSVGAFLFSNIAIARIGVNRNASFAGISTVVSILSGVLVLHERFSAGQVIGAAVIILGVYIANAGKSPD